MEERPRKRRSRQTVTRFDDTRRRTILIGVGILIVMAVVGLTALVINLALPDVALILELGGPSRNQNALPRNIDEWIVNADGTLRFASLFYPVIAADFPASEVFTVAGPLVDKADDIVSAEPFGALNSSSEILPGPGGDSSRVYAQYVLERDPQSDVYGVEVLTANPPYIVADSKDPATRILAMQAKTQNPVYYSQMIVAIAFAPGTRILSIAYVLPDPFVPVEEVIMRPYRRIELNGWLVYYFDVTSLPSNRTIRFRYYPGHGSSNLDIFDIDARR